MSTAAPPAAVPAAAGEEVASAPASSEATAAHSRRKQRNTNPYANVLAAEIIDSLPLETRLMVRRRQYGGFWQAEFLLKGMAAAGTCFEPDPSDIFLASLPKSGTTWLKALAFATLNRATHSPADDQHPLNHRNPHDCVGFLEFTSGYRAPLRASTSKCGVTHGGDHDVDKHGSLQRLKHNLDSIVAA